MFTFIQNNKLPVISALLLLCGAGTYIGFANSSQIDSSEVPRVLNADKPYNYGDAVLLKVQAYSTKPVDLRDVQISWKLYDGYIEKNYSEFDSSQIFFSAGLVDKKYFVITSVTYTYVKNRWFVGSSVEVKNFLLVNYVVVGKPPEPTPPTPPTPPNPPVPVTELEKQLHESWKLESVEDKSVVSKLSSIFQEAGSKYVFDNGIARPYDLKELIKNTRISVINNQLPNIRKSIETYLNSKLSTNSQEVFTPVTRQTTSSVLLEVSGALNKLKQ